MLYFGGNHAKLSMFSHKNHLSGVKLLAKHERRGIHELSFVIINHTVVKSCHRILFIVVRG